MKSDLKVIPVSKKKLRDDIVDNKYNNYSSIPFSKNKAMWLLKSPRIEDNDLVALYGISNDDLVAFIFLLPDILNKGGIGSKKVYWIIRWWVNEEFKNTVLGSYMFSETLRMTKNQVIVKAYAENVNEFYAKQPFSSLKIRKRHTIFFRPNPDILIGKIHSLKHFKGILKIVDSLSYKLVRFWNKQKIGKKTQMLEYEYLDKIDDETWGIIKPLCENDIIYKTKEYINWQLDSFQYATIQTSNKKNLKGLALIHGNAKNISLKKIKVSVKNKVIGFISFLQINEEVYLKYFMYSNNNFDIMITALMEHLIKFKASHLFTDNEEIAKAIKMNFKTIFMYRIAKTALVHNNFASETTRLELKEQDGHFI